MMIPTHLPQSIHNCSLRLAGIAMLMLGTTLTAADTPPTTAPQAEPRRQPLSTAESLSRIEVLPGLKVELVASEPEVVDPVSARFDHRGRLWVVEMSDYPTGPPEGSPPSGKIKVLTDDDGDGYFETVTVFADRLVFPTGVQPFRDGVIATLAGEVSYLADTTGDGVCDYREVWFTGFSEGNEQLRANHPTWTLENQIHVASGLRGGEVESQDQRWAGDKPLSLATRDFRFSPFGGQWHAVAGNSQYGYYQDDTGRDFICSNRNPCELLLAAADQVATNPLLPLPQWRASVMPAAEQSEVFPLVDAWTTSTLHAGQFTAACGVYHYQSDRLAAWLEGDFFACEPTGSLVQRYRQTAAGIVPTTQRGRPGKEFLASTDPWFRPVDLLDGPDGSMYVIDMHRAVIEHPAWMPKELQQRGDLRWGDQAGRIYRIVPDETPATPASTFDFETATAPQVVSRLTSPNRWTRVTAGRRIAEAWHDPTASPTDRGAIIDSLRRLIRTDTTVASESETPRSTADKRTSSLPATGAIRALWLLESFGELTADDVTLAATSGDAAVRRQAIRLQARHRDDWPELTDTLNALAADADPLVRYQWLLEVAPSADDVSLVAPTVRAARYHPDDTAVDRTWIANALSLAADPLAPQLVRHSLELAIAGEATVDLPTLAPLVKRLGWGGSAETLEAILNAAEDAANRPIEGRDEPTAAGVKRLTREIDTLFDQYASGMAVRARPWSAVIAADDADETTAKRLASRLDRDRQSVTDADLPSAERVAALRRIGLDRSPATLELCRDLVESQSDDLLIESLQILRHFDAADLAELLVSRVVELPPRASTATVAALIGNANWTTALLDALESGRIPWGLIDPTSLGRLERHADREIAERVKQLRASLVTEDREALMTRYLASLDGPADPAAGKAVFVKQCAGCHRIDGEGVVVGPDISDLRTQTPQQLLVAILDPNAAIDANYYRYAVLTDDGQLIEGLLEDSNQQSVTLKLQDNVRRVIPRDQVEQLRATGVSMMPDGFENQIDPDAMRDLIAYLKRWRLLSGEIPLGQK